MSFASLASPLNVDLNPGQPPIFRTEADVDPSHWAGEHREALRAAVAEHGSVLVRGLGLRDVTEVGVVYRRLASGLMAEREAFAPRQAYSEGVYSSTTWPASQQMCMHHELSYALEFPGLMLFACLQAPPVGGVTGVADDRAMLDAIPPDIVRRFESEGWLLA